MNPAQIKVARETLGLSQRGLAEALRLGPNGERTVRRWECGDVGITGPAQVAVGLMLSIREMPGVLAGATKFLSAVHDQLPERPVTKQTEAKTGK